MGFKVKLTRKSEGKSTKAKKKPRKQAQVDPRSLGTVQGSFDLSNNAFGKAESVRRLLTGFTLFTTAGITGMILFTLALNSGTGTMETDAQESQIAGQEYLLTLTELDSSGGYSATDLRSHILPRQQKYVATVSGEVDYVKVYESATAAVTASGLQLQSIGFSVGESAPAPAPAPVPEEGEEAAAPVAPPAATNLVQVSISATGPTSAGSAFQTQLSSVPGFAIVESTFSAGGDGDTVFSVVVNINPDTGNAFYTKRAQEVPLMNEYGLLKSDEGFALAPVPGGAIVEATEELADPTAPAEAPIDPETGLPVDIEAPVDPETGLPIDIEVPIDPETGLPLDPQTGLPIDIDSETVVPVDPETGLPLDIDPDTILPTKPIEGADSNG